MKCTRLVKTITCAGLIVFCADSIATANINRRFAELFETSIGHEYSGNLDSALNDVLQIIRVDANHYIANYRAAWLYYLKGQYEDSITYYKKGAAIKPKAIEPLLGMMLPLTALKQWPRAEALGEEILRKAPLNYLAGSRLAFIYFSQGKYHKAEVQYMKVLESYSSEIEMMLGLGWTYQKQGKKAEARKMFEEVLSISNNNKNALNGIRSL
jgi:tetratricopeptide (TPR) repeat protein